MEQIKALSIINLFGINKVQIKDFADLLIDEVNNGNINPLELFVKVKAIEETIKIVKDSIKDTAINEANKYGKDADYLGCRITTKMAGVKYDYSNCNDPLFNELDSEIKRLTELKKERENFLKTVKTPMQICDESTGGEPIEINPCIKLGSETLEIKFK